MHFFIAAVLVLGSWNPAHTSYKVGGHTCGMVMQGDAPIGNIIRPWYAITFGEHKHTGIAFKTQKEALREVEAECAADAAAAQAENQ